VTTLQWCKRRGSETHASRWRGRTRGVVECPRGALTHALRGTVKDIKPNGIKLSIKAFVN